VAVIACLVLLALAFVRWRRKAPAAAAATAARDTGGFADAPRPVSALAYTAGATPAWNTTLLLALGIAVGTALVSRPWIALVAAGATVLAAQVPRSRVALVVAVPALLGLSRLLDHPELAWCSLALVAVDLAVAWLRVRRADGAGGGPVAQHAPSAGAPVTTPTPTTVPRP